MPVTPTYPGVYVQEIPSGVRTIAAVSTSDTAFIGRALRGPVNDPIMCNNFGDFERNFGGLWADSTLGYAVRDFYLNGGARSLIVRLYRPEFADDAARQAAVTTQEGLATTAANAVIAAADAQKAVSNDAMVAAAKTAVAAASTGTAATATANYLLDVLRAEAGKKLTASNASTLAQAQITTAKTTATTLKAAYDKALTGIAGTPDVPAAIAGGKDKVKNEPAAVKNVVNAFLDGLAGSADVPAVTTAVTTESTRQADIATACDAITAAVIAEAALAGSTAGTVANAAGTAKDTAIAAKPTIATELNALDTAIKAATASPPTGDTIMTALNAAKAAAVSVGANTAAPREKAVLTVNGVGLEAKYPGAWGNELRARITTITASEGAKSFNLYVRDDATGKVESFLDVSTDAANVRFVTKIVESESSLVTVTAVPASPTPSNPTADGGVVADRDAWTDTNSTAVAADGYGGDGLALNSADYLGDEANKEGIYALEKVELFNLLCIPPYSQDVDLEDTIIDTAIAYCVKRRAFMILDPAKDWTDKDKAKAGMSALPYTKSDYAAVFFPRLKMRDPQKANRVGIFPPCGAVAGIFARTDSSRGIWKAPAGLEATLVGVPELSVKLSDPENGELNPLGLNCMRIFPTGRTVWGSRTLKGDDRFASEYKYISVRRMALHIENSLYRGLQWVVFEPNDEPLWAQIRMNVGAFMHGLFRQGAFEGAKPADAYFVKCDGETTTATDRNLGVVNIIVGFAPLKPAEFVVISLQQMTRQES